MILCAQGQLKKCKQIDLDKWKDSANSEVESIAKKAKKKKQVDREKRKSIALKQMNKVMEDSTHLSKAEIKAEHRVQREANKLTQEITQNKRLNPHEKMTSIN